jgi:hypothetical protein
LTLGLCGALLLGGAENARAGDIRSSVMGWVEDSRGLPVPGAVVSLFAKGMRGGGLVAFSDNAGRFVLPSLPPGSYTVRAIGSGARPAAARQITVLPNQEFILALSLPSLGEISEQEAAEKRRELSWLVRHKTRSILENRGVQTLADASDSLAFTGPSPWGEGFGGSLEFVASTNGGAADEFDGTDTLPMGTGALKLAGRIADGARFTLGGVLAENDDTAWRMAAEFVIDGEEGHEARAGAGYGTRFVRPLGASGIETDPSLENSAENGAVGALFVEDRVELSDHFSARAGLRHTYIGFVQDRNHFDPAIALELKPSEASRFHVSAEERTLVPGGDLLTLSTLATAPAILYAALPTNLRAERIVRFELGADRTLSGTLVGVRVFDEETQDQLVNAFMGRGAVRELRIFNAGSTGVRGASVDVTRGFGTALRGSFGYSYGRVHRASALGLVSGPSTVSLPEGSYHDLTGRVEARMDPTDTRLVAFYRLNLMSARGDELPVRNTRFDVQVSQGLPFIGALTRADWELLVAVRNLFYETADAGTLDELAVVAPPTRVIGGISVRF